LRKDTIKSQRNEGLKILLSLYMFKIGLAEDDIKIGGLIKAGLEESGYEVDIFANGSEALFRFQENSYDLLILDVMIPGINGIALCKELRKTNTTIPILILTALGSIDDKVNGLNAGADDYLLKPFHFKELLARLEALLRRGIGPTKQPQLLTFADLTMDLQSKIVERGGIEIELTAKEYDLLELFLKNPNRLLSRQYIAESVWDISFDTGTNVIDVYINFLRKKMERGNSSRLLHTKIGMGYILKES
jgi:two-component system copper resistance phosphate regulon response regulator CusR